MASAALSQRDVSSVLAAADVFLQARSIEQLRQQTVDTVARLLPGTVVSWNELELSGKPLAMVRSEWPLAPTEPDRLRELDEAFKTYVFQHPVIARYERTRDGRPYAISDFVTPTAFHATSLYRHLFRPLGLEDQISFVLPDPKLMVGIAANRQQWGFPPRERMICNLLRPHLVNARRHVDALVRAKEMLDVVRQLAGDHGEAAIVLGADGTPERMGPDAVGLLQRFFGPFDPRKLPDNLRAWLNARTAVGSPPLLYQRDGRSLAVRHVKDGERDILFLFEKPDTNKPADARQLGLTARESQIVTLLADGLTSKRMAAAFSISPRTVDKHVATILDKLGVRTRLEAVSLMAQNGWHSGLHATPLTAPEADRSSPSGGVS